MKEPRAALAEEIVDAILDRPSADPDDDLAKLARRYLRADPYLRSEGPGQGALREALAEWDAIEGSDIEAQFRAFIAAGKMADAIRGALAAQEGETPTPFTRVNGQWFDANGRIVRLAQENPT